MGTKQTQTQSTRIARQGSQESDMLGLLAQLARSGAAGMGDLSDLASGNLQISGQDAGLIRQINELSAEQARKAATQNYEQMSAQVEEGLLARGLEGSSVEAVNQALLGQQLQATLDQSALQRQITSAQQMRQQVLDRAGLQLNANQLLLNQLLSGAGAVTQHGLQERLAQTSVTGTQETNAMGSALGALGQVGGLALSAFVPGAGTAAGAASGIRGASGEDYRALGGNNPYVQLG